MTTQLILDRIKNYYAMTGGTPEFRLLASAFSTVIIPRPKGGGSITRHFLIWFKQLPETVCETCGEPHWSCLQFHHRDAKTKITSVTQMATVGVNADMLVKEMAKCDLICANCHFKLHHP